MAAKKSADTKKKSESAESASSTATSTVSSKEVTLGHVFKVRPKINTSFRPPDFARAKKLLEKESYETIRDAARAVAEEALSLTRGDAVKATSRKRQ